MEKASARAGSLFTNAPVTAVTFFQVIPGVKVPVQLELPLEQCEGQGIRSLTACFSQAYHCALLRHWGLPSNFNPRRGLDV